MGVLRALRLKIAGSHLAILAEGAARRFWPLSTFVLMVFTFVAFNGLSLFPSSWVINVLGGAVSVAIGLLGFGIYGLKISRPMAALARLDAGMDARPLASLRDHAVDTKDALTRALWEKHQNDMATRAGAAQVTPPDLRLSSRDPYGLRLMALVGALAAVLFMPADIAQRVKSAMVGPVTAGPIGVSFEAWANPPEYTGLPVIYLHEDMDVLNVPVGSEIVVRAYGITEMVRLRETVSGMDTALTANQPSLRNTRFTLVKSGDVTLFDNEKMLGTWQFTATADSPPTVMASGDVARNDDGFFSLPFISADDYSVVGGTASITLDMERLDRRYGLAVKPQNTAPITRDLPLPYTGAMLVEDFAEHPWAGLPVVITLHVVDDIGQAGTSSPIEGSLLARRFFVPLAAAIIEQRRDILWSPENDRRVKQVLRAISYLPADFGLSAGDYLMLQTTLQRFEDTLSQDREAAAIMLWELALQLEEGDLADAAERLARAQEKLLQAIEDNADKAEIAELMEELRAATDNYMDMLAQQAEQQGDIEQAENQEPPADGADAMEQLLNELQQLAENGDKEAARRLLELMQEMMDNMQMAEGQGQDGRARQMEQMQDTLREQQGLSDDTFEGLQEQLDSEEGELPNAEELAQRQEALQQLLEGMQGEAGGEETQEALDQAGENMGKAGDMLGEGDASGALDEQARAIESLREGIRKLSEEMQRAGRGQDGTDPGEAFDNALETDPLGRPLGIDGTTETGEQLLPEMSEADRAQELLDEIRRRSGQQTRPEIEREYLRRLLDGF